MGGRRAPHRPSGLGAVWKAIAEAAPLHRAGVRRGRARDAPCKRPSLFRHVEEVLEGLPHCHAHYAG
eukprot:2746427-Pyramimonas_sp.AAC.1